MAIKNIVFDMGNVLIHFDKEHFLDAIGAKGEDRALLIKNVYASLEWARLDSGSMTEAQAAKSMCKRLPARLHDKVHALVDEWDRPIIPMEGMADLIKDLKQSGYGIYLLSNASLRQHEYWERIPGNELFDGTVISADEKAVKPESKIYEALYSKFSLTPEECLFIDDMSINCEAAERSGMKSIVFHGDSAELREELIIAGIGLK